MGDNSCDNRVYMLDLMCSTVYIKSNMQKDVIRQFKIGLLKQKYNQISLMSEFSIKNFDSLSLM